MAATQPGKKGQPTSTKSHRQVDDWEEWEDEEVITPVEIVKPGQGPGQAGQTRAISHGRSARSENPRASRFFPASKLRRLKSRQRQKAKNAEAGIRLITDMSAFGRGKDAAKRTRSPLEGTGKFVDAAALRALEGEPNSASIGNWNWLKKTGRADKSRVSGALAHGDRSADGAGADLSPEDRPIVIGISLASSETVKCEKSSHVACDNERHSFADRGLGKKMTLKRGNGPSGRDAQRSMWSPDTPNTLCTLSPSQGTPSVISQAMMPGQVHRKQAPPPVPALPLDYAKTMAAKGSGIDGWWDHVVTPFTDERMSFSAHKAKAESPKEDAHHRPWLEHETNKNPRLPPADKTLPVEASLVKDPQVGEKNLHVWPVNGSRAAVGSSSAAPTSQKTVTGDPAGISDCPPPYSPPPSKVKEEKTICFASHLQTHSSPSSSPAGLAATITSQGVSRGPASQRAASAHAQAPRIGGEPLPVRVAGTFLPREHGHAATGSRHKVERRRRRHEKEDVLARRAGGLWRGRWCVPSKGCFGRSGREGRKRRRVWLTIWGVIAALIILVILLAVLLSRHRNQGEVAPVRVNSTDAPSRPAQDMPYVWVNLTEFPPMPSGVLTIVGPDNTAAKSDCTEPSTLWSCSIPKDQQASVAPYRPNQPSLMMQIQWDDNKRKTWNISNGDPPEPVNQPARRALGVAARVLSMLKRSQTPPSDYSPNPKPPTYQEMWFLGNTTDNIKSDLKGGEPTPFYISLIRSVNDTVPPPRVIRRESSPEIGNTTFKTLIPRPDLEADGTSKPATMMPNPVQQPMRLFDRGLPTEHYGFYTYFKRSIFLKSVLIQTQTDDTIPLDQDGGCRKTEASHLVTWGETRLHVQIWTRALEGNTSTLLKADGSKGIGGTGQVVRPGTMPYPVTITHDTHGGDPNKKLVWGRPIDERLQVQTDAAEALINDMGVGGTWINRRGANGDGRYGGFDGGTGGCKCEWTNWV